MSSAGYEIFKLGYQISPVILVDGIAAQIPGQMLPILALTQSADFTLGILNGNTVPLSLDQYFAHWKPLPGSTLVSIALGTYPFANQNIAANAIIAQPLQISMLMNCPVQEEGGYTAKLATMTVLAQALSLHNRAGGTYTVATPSQVYTNCMLMQVRDVSGGESKQVQHTWQFDFQQPLITVNQATQVYNSLMNRIASGYPTGTQPSWSGVSATVAASVAGSTGGSTLLPSMTNLVGGLASSPSTTGLTGVGSNSFSFLE